MNRILEKIKKRIDEIQSDCLDDHYNFKNSHNEGVFEGLSKLESYIESLETDIDMKEWKDAQGKDLPDINREVIALEQDKNGYMKVVYAHRPNPNGDAKIYDRGGWNIPNLKYWLDYPLPE